MDRIAAPAGWRDDGPNAWDQDAWKKLPSQPPPNCAWNPDTRTWEAPRRSIPQPVDSEDWDVWGDEDYSLAYCTPSRRRSLTAQPQAQPKPITYAQYDPAFDDDLHPQPVPAVKPQPMVPAPQPVPVEPEGIPVEWPTRIVQPVPLQPRA